jgi:hypothetical protein
MKKIKHLLLALVFSLFTFASDAAATACSFSIASSYCSDEEVTMSYTADTAGQSEWPHSFFAGVSGNWEEYSEDDDGVINLGIMSTGTYSFYSFNAGDQCGSGVPWDACVNCANSGSPPGSVNTSYKKTFSVVDCTPPPTCSLSGSPTSIYAGQSTTLSWSTSNTTSRSINKGVGNVAKSGSRSVSPTSTTTYILSVNGAGGSTSCSRKIRVLPPPAPTCSLSLSPNPAASKTQKTLTWSTTNSPTSASINCIGTVTPATGGNTTVSPEDARTYTMTVNNAYGTGTCSVNSTLSATTFNARPWNDSGWSLLTKTDRITNVGSWITGNITKRISFLAKPWDDAGYGAATLAEQKSSQRDWQYLRRRAEQGTDVYVLNANKKITNSNANKEYFIPEKTAAEWTAFMNAVTGGGLPDLTVANIDACDTQFPI